MQEQKKLHQLFFPIFLEILFMMYVVMVISNVVFRKITKKVVYLQSVMMIKCVYAPL